MFVVSDHSRTTAEGHRASFVCTNDDLLLVRRVSLKVWADVAGRAPG